MRPFRTLKSLLVGVVIVGLIGLNLATLTVGAVFDTLSAAIETVSDRSTVRTAHAASVKASKAETARLRRSNSALQRRVVRLERQLSRARQSARVARAHRGRFERELAGARAALSTARQRMARMVQGVGRVTAGVTARAAGRIGRNIAGLVPENVPFAGIAVSLALLGYELRASCESAQDLARLRERAGLAADPDGSVATICGQSLPSLDQLWADAVGHTGDRGTLLEACLRAAGGDIDARDACRAKFDEQTPPVPPQPDFGLN